jgi:hydrogenase expression/formation protein HypC
MEVDTMCLAVPLKIISIDGKNAVAEIDGISRKIRIDFTPNANIGDYVIVHAGFAIEKLTEEMAKENLKAIREVSDALEENVQR